MHTEHADDENSSLEIEALMSPDLQDTEHGSRFRGGFDFLTGLALRGWVVDLLKPTDELEFILSVEGVELGVAITNFHRSDIWKFIGQNRAGFDISLDQWGEEKLKFIAVKLRSLSETELSQPAEIVIKVTSAPTKLQYTKAHGSKAKLLSNIVRRLESNTAASESDDADFEADSGPAANAKVDLLETPVAASTLGDIRSGSRYRGGVDTLLNGVLTGWAVDLLNPRAPIDCVFQVDGQFVASGRTSQFRKDIQAHVPGNVAGFVFDLGTSADEVLFTALDRIEASEKGDNLQDGALTIELDGGASRILLGDFGITGAYVKTQIQPLLAGGRGKVAASPANISSLESATGVSIKLLFDLPFYNAQLGSEIPLGFEEAIRHYQTVGYLQRYTPSRFFDPEYYVEHSPDLAVDEIDLYVHFMLHGWRERRKFHPSLSHDVISDFMSGKAQQNPVIGLSYSIIRNMSVEDVFGRRAARNSKQFRSDWTSWLEGCVKRGELKQAAVASLVENRPHLARFQGQFETLFDTQFYLSQLAEAVSPPDALKHYLDYGWSQGLDPHPLFRSAFYVDRYSDIREHRLNPFLHYIEFGSTEGRWPHPLFEPLFYRSRLTIAEKHGADALLHFLRSADANKPSPCRFFSETFYRNTVLSSEASSAEVFLHYVMVGSAKGFRPHPLFDSEYYNVDLNTSQTGLRTAFEHFCAQKGQRRAPFALFDPVTYREKNVDLHNPTFCPVSHYMEIGYLERWNQPGNILERPINGLISKPYVAELNNDLSFGDRPYLWEYYRRNQNKRTRVIFCGHEASRTGAPAILLGIVRYCAGYKDVECITILDSGGPLVYDYSRHSHVADMGNLRRRFWTGELTWSRFEKTLDDLMVRFSDNIPSIVICNSVESRPYAAYFKSRGFPVVFLVHEIAGFYAYDEMSKLVDDTDKIIFPAQFVADCFERVSQLRPRQGVILPQGLLRDNYGDVRFGSRARIFKGLPIDDDDIVVMGCGSVDGRKGFDIFVTVARLAQATNPGPRAIKFVWVGGAPSWHRRNGAPFDSVNYWASWEIEWNELEEIIHVINEVPNTEPYMVCADLFLMTSRVDPFPCVIHEAMASKLPILCFEKSGGAPEAIGDHAGVVLPYQDVAAMASHVVSLAYDDERRKAMGEAGYHRVKSVYRFEPYAENVIRLAAEVADVEGRLGARIARPPASQPRVFFACPAWNISGVNTFTEALVNYLNDNGVFAEVIFTTGENSAPREGEMAKYGADELPGCKYRWLQPNGYSKESRLKKLREFLEENAPCILAPNYDYDITEIAFNLPSNLGVIGIAHADDAEHYAHCYKMGNYWNKIIAVSDFIKSEIVKTNPGFGEKTVTIRYGLQPPNAKSLEPDVERKIADVVPIKLLYAGRFETFQKRILDYCDLANALTVARVPFHLTMVGDGVQFAAVRQKMSPHITAGKVTLTGRLSQAETSDLMREAHVILVLSDFEGLPLALIEGMQRGCIPVVYQMSSGIPEVLVNGENGFIVRKRDFKGIAAALKQIIADDQLRERLVRASMATSERLGLTQEAMGAAYKAVIESVHEEISGGQNVERAESVS